MWKRTLERWLGNMIRRRPASTGKKKPKSLLRMEMMEDRLAPSSVTVSFQEGVNYTGGNAPYAGTHDSHIRYLANSTNFGNATVVEIDRKSEAYQGLLRFDNIFGLGNGQIPIGSKILSANLTLAIVNPSVRGSYGSLYRMLQGWDEDTVTWNSFTTPGGGVQNDGIQAVEVADAFAANGIPNASGSLGNASFVYYTFDVTTSLKAWTVGELNFGWLIDQYQGDGWDFASSENANVSLRPLLTVTFEPPTGNGVFSFATSSIVQNEGNIGNTTINVKVFREAGSLGNASVDYSLAVSPGTATLGVDYTFANGTLNFADGERIKSFTVTIVGDTIIEGHETINLILSNPTGGATIDGGNLTITIADNDVLLNEIFMDPPGTDDGYEFIEIIGTPGASLGNIGGSGANIYFVAFEGDSGAGLGNADIVVDLGNFTLGSTGLLVIRRAGTFHYTLPPGVTEVTVPASQWALENGTASYALILSPTPFTGPNTVDYDLNDDGILDNLPAGAMILDSIGVTDNGGQDVAPGLSLPPLQIVPQSGDPDAISRENTITDAGWIPNRLFSWYGGEVTSNVTPVYERILSEGRRVTSNTPPGARVTPGELNVPRVIEFASTQYSANETTGNSTVTITVLRLGDLSGNATVNYTTNNGTAINGLDFIGASGTLTFLTGESSKTIDITILPDSIPEGFETFTLTLSSPSAPFLIGLGTTTVTITDDDSIVASFQNGIDGYLGTQDTGLIGWMPDLPAGSDLSISIDQADRDPTVSGSPLVPLQGLIRFDDIFGNGTGQIPFGSQIYSAFLTLNVTNTTASTTQLPFYRMLQDWSQDTATWDNPNSSITFGVTPDDVEASSVPDGMVPTPNSLGKINIPLSIQTLQAWAAGGNNYGWLITSNSSDGWDFSSSEAFNEQNRPKLTVVYTPPSGPGAFTFEYNSFRVVEGDLVANVTVNRVGGFTGNATVDYTIAAGTATAGVDFIAGNGTLTFLDGEISKTFSVTIINDSVAEPNETVLLTLSNPTGGATLLPGGANATLTIRNDDIPTGLLLNEISVNPPGTDQPWEYIEIIGTPNVGMGSVYLVVLEGEISTDPLMGTAEHVIDLSSYVNGSSGLSVVKASSGGHTIPTGVTIVPYTDLNVGTSYTLENGGTSYLLLFSPNATIARFIDYDWNNNGTLKLPAGVTLLDAVGWKSAANDIVYGGVELTQSGNGVPDAATRFHGNTTALDVGAWYNGDLQNHAGNASILYDLGNASVTIPANAIITPGAPNLVNAAPVITSDGGGNTANITVANSSLAVTTVTATDANIEQVLTYSIAGGANASLFTINSGNGVLTFDPSIFTAPPYPAAGTYEVIVQVTDPAGATDTQTIYVTVPSVSPPTVTSLLVNGSVDPSLPNTVQSMLTSITINFSTNVYVAAGAFTLTGVDPFGGNVSVPVGNISVAGNGTNSITLTFLGTSNVSFGSLVNGTWTLNIDATKVTTTSGNVSMSSNYTNSNIKRLFGDWNGDGVVDTTDDLAFGSTFFLSTGDTGFDPAFDFNNDGIIDSTDEGEFYNSFGLSL